MVASASCATAQPESSGTRAATAANSTQARRHAVAAGAFAIGRAAPDRPRAPARDEDPQMPVGLGFLACESCSSARRVATRAATISASSPPSTESSPSSPLPSAASAAARPPSRSAAGDGDWDRDASRLSSSRARLRRATLFSRTWMDRAAGSSCATRSPNPSAVVAASSERRSLASSGSSPDNRSAHERKAASTSSWKMRSTVPRFFRRAGAVARPRGGLCPPLRSRALLLAAAPRATFIAREPDAERRPGPGHCDAIFLPPAVVAAERPRRMGALAPGGPGGEVAGGLRKGAASTSTSSSRSAKRLGRRPFRGRFSRSERAEWPPPAAHQPAEPAGLGSTDLGRRASSTAELTLCRRRRASARPPSRPARRCRISMLVNDPLAAASDATTPATDGLSWWPVLHRSSADAMTHAAKGPSSAAPKPSTVSSLQELERWPSLSALLSADASRSTWTGGSCRLSKPAESMVLRWRKSASSWSTAACVAAHCTRLSRRSRAQSASLPCSSASRSAATPQCETLLPRRLTAPSQSSAASARARPSAVRSPSLFMLRSTARMPVTATRLASARVNSSWAAYARPMRRSVWCQRRSLRRAAWSRSTWHSAWPAASFRSHSASTRSCTLALAPSPGARAAKPSSPSAAPRHERKRSDAAARRPRPSSRHAVTWSLTRQSSSRTRLLGAPSSPFRRACARARLCRCA
mmetsp:Transcript_3411/g.8433  ORF Transcript_3411/g.8433 Transcript_3411/m.8433 type:complete len:699 (-) Transcript_3411:228-2324(-)